MYDQGAGVYVTINETDLRGRRSANITRIRAVWQEDDNGFQGALPLDPSLTVETSPTHHHRYWLVGDEWPADTQGCADFIAIMERMIASYASDKNVKDTARVLRLPGFVNRQHGVPHHVVRIVAATGRRYTRAEITAAFPPIVRPQKKTPQQHEWKPQGDELRRIHDALECIDADDRNTWIQCGMAIKAELGEAGRLIWDQWSRGSDKFNEADQTKNWTSLGRRNGITIATLFWYAKKAGWQDTRHENYVSPPAGDPPPSTATEKANGKDDPPPPPDDTETETELKRLLKLSGIEYARARKAAAKNLGIPAGTLDKEINERHKQEKEAETPAAWPHWVVEAWPEPINSEHLLQALIGHIRKYVVLTPEQAIVVALWVIFTWVHDKVAVRSPILLVTSPEPNCGKSTLLGVIGYLVRQSLVSVLIKGPALFRSIEKWHPTFVIDEADTALVSNDDLKEVVNSGWTRGPTVVRCHPETLDPCPFSTFAPKAIGMKGRNLPDTTLSSNHHHRDAAQACRREGGRLRSYRQCRPERTSPQAVAVGRRQRRTTGLSRPDDPGWLPQSRARELEAIAGYCRIDRDRCQGAASGHRDRGISKRRPKPRLASSCCMTSARHLKPSPSGMRSSLPEN